LNAEGELVTQRDGVPVYGERPIWSWWDSEVIRDEYVLDTDLDLSAGTYTISVGMYDPPTGVRLPVTGPSGERLGDDWIVLDEIQVNTP
jgi:hypothetical protein